MSKISYKKVFESLRGDDLGGDINFDASNLKTGEIHCWNGERYQMTITRLPNGCKYDTATGKPVDS